MGANARIEGRIKLGSGLLKQIQEYKSLLLEEFELTEFLLKKAERTLGLNPGDLWIIEDFQVEVEGEIITFEVEGKIQYNGIEAFLIFLAEHECVGKVGCDVKGEIEYFFVGRKGEVKRKSFYFDLDDNEEDDVRVTEEILDKEEVIKELG